MLVSEKFIKSIPIKYIVHNMTQMYDISIIGTMAGAIK